MKDLLQDIINHTYDLGCIDLIKIEGTEDETSLSGLAADRSVVVQGKFAAAEPEFIGTFGMPNMSTLKTILSLDPYNEDAKITVKTGKSGPESMHFENAAGDFKNDYRFMVQSIVDNMLKEVKFKGANWDIEIEPSMAAIQRLKYQSQANSNEGTFQATTKDGDLIFSFGDHSTHSGSFTFETDVEGTLTKDWHWPVNHVINILSLHGDKTMRISNDGATEITVNSGLAEYTYILPAQSE